MVPVKGINIYEARVPSANNQRVAPRPPLFRREETDSRKGGSQGLRGRKEQGAGEGVGFYARATLPDEGGNIDPPG